MDTPDLFVYLISGTLPTSALIYLRQLSLLIQLNQLGPSHSSYIHAVLTLQSTPHPKWSWWTKMALTCTKYDISSPLLILSSKLTKNQLKSQFKKKVSAYWYNYYVSMCPLYSSLKFLVLLNQYQTGLTHLSYILVRLNFLIINQVSC